MTQSHFDLSAWRHETMGLKKPAVFWANLNQTFCDLHDAPHRNGTAELTCSELVEQLLASDFLEDGITPMTAGAENVLRWAGKKADELDHEYHGSAHIREVTLSSIGLIDWLEKSLGAKFSTDFKLNAVVTALVHDLAHPGQAESKNLTTEAMALQQAVPYLTGKLNVRRNIEPIIIATLATAQPFFALPAELQERYNDTKKIILARYSLHNINPIVIEHTALANLMGAADLIPSLASPERLVIGAMKFNIESNLPVTAESVLQTANGFLKAVESSNSPFMDYGIPVDFDGLRKGLEHPALRNMLEQRITHHQNARPKPPQAPDERPLG